MRLKYALLFALALPVFAQKPVPPPDRPSANENALLTASEGYIAASDGVDLDEQLMQKELHYSQKKVLLLAKDLAEQVGKGEITKAAADEQLEKAKAEDVKEEAAIRVAYGQRKANNKHIMAMRKSKIDDLVNAVRKELGYPDSESYSIENREWTKQ